MELNTRSASYQWKIKEISWESDALAAFAAQEDSLTQEQKEQLMDLYEELKKQFWRVAKKGLTAQQYDVLFLISQGLTQEEVAKKLGINQSSVAKSMAGAKQNGEYEGKFYGGSIKKMKRLLDQDDEVKKILDKINEILY